MGKLKYLRIKAGKRAIPKLMESGLKPEMVSAFSAAAGGPKWIILYHMDRYLMKDFFSYHQHTIHFLGGSIGAWRSMCYLLNDPLEAIERLRDGYLNQRYDDPFRPEIISDTCHNIILESLGNNGIESILNNDKRKLHVSTTQAHFSSQGKSNAFLKFKFGQVALANLFQRKWMNLFISRHFYTTSSERIIDDDGINTSLTSLCGENIIPALRSSGAIPISMVPIVINGVEHWDGGIVDYHLDLKYRNIDGVILYPHFLPFIRPGWFDKWTKLRYSRHHDDTLLIYPSQEFINMLPDQQLTSLQDFYTYKDDQDLRIKKWFEACDLGKYLAEDLDRLMTPAILEEHITSF